MTFGKLITFLLEFCRKNNWQRTEETITFQINVSLFSRGICQKILVKLSNKKYWGWKNDLPLFLPPPPPFSFLLLKLDVSLIDSSSCLTALDTASNNMLNRSGWSGHSCLVLDFRVEVFSHSLLSMIRAVGFS